MTITIPRWSLPLVFCALGFSVLGLYVPSGSAQQPAQLPFANAVEQRNEMIRELKAIKELLKEQTELIRKATQPDDEKR